MLHAQSQTPQSENRVVLFAANHLSGKFFSTEVKGADDARVRSKRGRQFSIELKVLVYPLVPVMWLRLLFVVSAYHLPSSQKELYIYIFAASLGAFILALKLTSFTALVFGLTLAAAIAF